MQSSLALFDRIFEYLDQPVDIVEGTRELERPRGDVAFEDVWFRYDDDAWTLEGRLLLGARRARRRRSSARPAPGKTTCGYLVARLYDATEGTVSIDGVDVSELTFASLAAAVGVVSQETYLFHATVRENLRFAKPDATDEEVEEAARAAQIHELIASLPDGYETVVGERGYRFSGGEKQRMAIARTILRNPPILVLDEATSALDTQTERPSRRRSSGWPRAARRSRSRIGSRRCATRTRSSCSTGAASSRRAPTRSCSRLGGRYAMLVARDADIDLEPRSCTAA